MGESRCRSWDGTGRVYLNPTPVCVMPLPQTHTCPQACAPPQPSPASGNDHAAVCSSSHSALHHFPSRQSPFFLPTAGLLQPMLRPSPLT